MKPHRLLPLLVLVLSAFMLSCDSGQQTVTAPDDVLPQFGRPDKPGDEPEVPGEWIAFTGDLTGGDMVEGCCPNGGPNPVYTLTLAGPPFPAGIAGTHTGPIFMNGLGRKLGGGYMVQFSWVDEDEDDVHYHLEIRGGEVTYHKRTKVLYVDFEDATMWRRDCDGGPIIEEYAGVNFRLTRRPTEPA